MSRILKRPMFRKGGSTNEGIMHGIVDRKGYLQGTTWEETLEKYPDIEEAYGAIGGIDQPRDTSMYEMLIGGGLNLVSGAGAGDGLMSNVAKSYKGPSEKYFEAQRARKAYDSELKRTAAQAGLQQKWKMDQIAAQTAAKDPYRKIFADKAFADYGDEFNRAQLERVVDYNLTEEERLKDKVGQESVGGIIDFDLNDNETRKKKLSKMGKDVGKYFYDPRDGKYKLLVNENGIIRFGHEWNSIEEIELNLITQPPPGSTLGPYAEQQAAIEKEKSEGFLPDEDIAAIRGY